MTRRHGVDPHSRLVRIYVETAEVDGARYGEIRRYINRRNPDGSIKGRVKGPQGLKRMAFHSQGLARDVDETAVLGAAFGLAVLRSTDDGMLYMPTQRSLSILRTMAEHPWVYRSRLLDNLFATAGTALRRCTATIAHDDEATREIMRLSLQQDIESQEISSFLRRYRSVVGGTPPLSSECRCGKSRFGKTEAELALLHFSQKKGRKPVRAYQCPTTSWWHLTSELRKRRNTYDN